MPREGNVVDFNGTGVRIIIYGSLRQGKELKAVKGFNPFDLNEDGETDMTELFIAYNIFQEVTKDKKKPEEDEYVEDEFVEDEYVEDEDQ